MHPRKGKDLAFTSSPHWYLSNGVEPLGGGHLQLPFHDVKHKEAGAVAVTAPKVAMEVRVGSRPQLPGQSQMPCVHPEPTVMVSPNSTEWKLPTGFLSRGLALPPVCSFSFSNTVITSFLQGIPCPKYPLPPKYLLPEC